MTLGYGHLSCLFWRDRQFRMLPNRWKGILKLALVGLAVAAVAIAVAIFAWAAPGNDIFQGTTIPTTTPYTNSVDTTTATTNNPPSGPDDPIPTSFTGYANCGPATALHSVWYNFTPNVNG